MNVIYNGRESGEDASDQRDKGLSKDDAHNLHKKWECVEV